MVGCTCVCVCVWKHVRLHPHTHPRNRDRWRTAFLTSARICFPYSYYSNLFPFLHTQLCAHTQPQSHTTTVTHTPTHTVTHLRINVDTGSSCHCREHLSPQQDTPSKHAYTQLCTQKYTWSVCLDPYRYIIHTQSRTSLTSEDIKLT